MFVADKGQGRGPGLRFVDQMELLITNSRIRPLLSLGPVRLTAWMSQRGLRSLVGRLAPELRERTVPSTLPWMHHVPLQ